MAVVQEIYVPQETVNDQSVLVTKLFFKNGDKVSAGNELLELETTKSTFTLEAGRAGYIHYVCKKDDVFDVGELLLQITDFPNEDSIKQKEPISSNFTEVEALKTNFSDSALRLIEKENISKESFTGMIFVSVEDVNRVLEKMDETRDVAWETIEKNFSDRMIPYLIFGGGYHTSNIIEIILTNNYGKPVGLINTSHTIGEEIFGLPIVVNNTEKEILKSINKRFSEMAFVLGIGHINQKTQKIRKKVVSQFSDSKVYCPNIIHQSAVIEPSVNLGVGNHVFAQSVISTNVIIGNFSIINSGSIISHDCVIGNNVHISPGAVLGGNVKVGENSIIGMNVTIHAGMTIPPGIIIMNGTNVLPKDFG